MEIIGKNPIELNIAGLLYFFTWLETMLRVSEISCDISMTSCRLKVKVKRRSRKEKENLQFHILRNNSAPKGKVA